MTITLRPGSTVVFAGDSITDCQRLQSEDGLGFGYPLRIAGEWGLRHPDRPVTWLNTGIGGNKVLDLEARWQADVLDAHPDVVSILIEPFLLPIHGVVQAGVARALIGEQERKEWRADLNPKIQAVRELADKYGAHLLPADSMFAELATTTGPEYWAEDGVHPTPAGHAALAAAWLRLVA